MYKVKYSRLSRFARFLFPSAVFRPSPVSQDSVKFFSRKNHEGERKIENKRINKITNVLPLEKKNLCQGEEQNTRLSVTRFQFPSDVLDAALLLLILLRWCNFFFFVFCFRIVFGDFDCSCVQK